MVHAHHKDIAYKSNAKMRIDSAKKDRENTLFVMKM
jgi:hypothetical protein